MSDAKVDTIQSDKDALKSGSTEAELWLKKIEEARKDERDWRTEAKEAVQVYEADKEASVTFNLFFSIVETIVPALYNSTPVPDVRRRFGDADPIAKQVVDLSERCLSYSQDQYDLDAVFTAMLRDGAVSGRGVVRIRYVPHETQQGVGYQEVKAETVPWDKIIFGPARTFEKLPWIAFEEDLTKDELTKLNPEMAGKSDLGEKSDRRNTGQTISKDPTGVLKTKRIYQIWDKAKREVVFVDDEKEIWKRVADPLGLEQFFPILKPFQPSRRVSSMVPMCPFTAWKPLFDELDVITKRIGKLVRQLKVRGLVHPDLMSSAELLKACEDGEYTSAKAESQQFMSGSGGMEAGIAHWPMDPTVKALQQLYLQRDAIKQTIYEVTGVADIMRGASDPNETLGAQKIKAQWGSLRVQMQQKQIAEIARALYRMKIEIMASHFTEENLAAMSSLPMSLPQEQRFIPGQPGPPGPDGQPTPGQPVDIWPQVMQVFKSDMRSFRVDIETDSTIRADLTRDQEQMNLFIGGTAQFIGAVSGLVQVDPAAVPPMMQVYTAFARNFKLGKQAEDALDSLSTRMQEAQAKPQEEKPDPAVQKAQMEMQTMQAKAQMEQQSGQQKMQMEAQSLQMKAAHEERMAALDEQKAQLDIQIKTIELQLKQKSAELDAQVKMQDAQLRSQERAEDHAFATEERQQNMQMQREGNEIKRESMADKAKFDRQAMQNKAKAAGKPQNGARA